MTLRQYAETVYFPNIKTKKSPSTVKGSSAVTFWNTNMNDLQDLLASALKAIEERYLRNPI
jgi:hypothetical protein